MKCRILHESRGRMRVRMLQRRMTVTQADKLHYYLQAQEEITKVTVSERTMDVTIYYKEKAGVRESVIQSLADFGYDRTEAAVPEHTGRELNRTYEDKLFSMVMRRVSMLRHTSIDVKMALTHFSSVTERFKNKRVLPFVVLFMPILPRLNG